MMIYTISDGQCEIIYVVVEMCFICEDQFQVENQTVSSCGLVEGFVCFRWLEGSSWLQGVCFSSRVWFGHCQVFGIIFGIVFGIPAAFFRNSLAHLLKCFGSYISVIQWVRVFKKISPVFEWLECMFVFIQLLWFAVLPHPPMPTKIVFAPKI